MKNKSNPILAAHEAKLERQYKQRLQRNSEVDMMALLIAANRELKVGSGRSGYFLAEYIDQKVEIAKAILKDDDPELLHTKKELAQCLRSILGEENWKQYRELFPLLREYWDCD